MVFPLSHPHLFILQIHPSVCPNYLPVIYAENPITAGNENMMVKEMDLSGYPYVLEQAEEVEEAYLEKIRCRLL